MKRLHLHLKVIFVLLFVLPAISEGANAIHAKLGNGLRVIIVQNKLAPVVSTMINYLVGSNEDPQGLPGMAHAQEHMMFRGSRGLDADQLSTIIAAMGGEFNADTQQTVTQYFFTVPSEDLDTALRIEAIRMMNVLDDRKLWADEKKAIEQEVAQDLSNPEYIFYSKLLSQMFAGTPYERDALGTRASFQKMTATDLSKFHRTWYRPNNAVLVISGDVEPAATLKKVKSIFGKIKRGPVPSRLPVRLRPLKPQTITLETDLPYGLAVLAYRLPGYKSPDYAAGQILADVLDSRRGALYALVPEGKALSSDFSSNSLPDAGLGYAAVSFPKGGDGSSLLSEMKKIISEYVNNGVPAELVEASKRHEIADEEFQMNSVEGLAAEWSRVVAVEGRTSPEEDINALKKVTTADVNRVAKEWLKNDTAVMAILTPRESGKPITKSFPGKESFAPEKVKKATLPPWAKKAVLLPKPPSESAKPFDAFLPNGIRLIVLPESISKTVSVFGRIKTNPDLQMPKGEEGVSDVLSNLFSYGTKTLGRLEFQEAVDDIAANLSAGTTFSLQVLSEKFDAGLGLLADNLLNPALPERAFKTVQKQMMGALAGKLQSPEYKARIAIRTGLYPKGDPSLREATPETVGRLTLDNVRSYYQQIFRPDMTTIVVIGNVSPGSVRTAIEKYFGNWKAEGPKPNTDLPAVPANKPSFAAVPDESRVQVLVMLEETAGLTRSNPDYYMLQLGRSVLSGAFYATRLYRDLRERAGLVYSVDAFLDAKKNRSLFGVAYACDPQNVSGARAIVERDLTAMQKDLLSNTELNQAKTILIRQITLSRSSVSEIAERYLSLSLEDLPLDEPFHAAKIYYGAGSGDVKEAYTKWIRPADFVQVTLGPLPK